MKLQQVFEARESLSRLMELRDLPFKISYALSKQCRHATSDLTFIEQERQKLVKELGELQEDGSFQVKDPQGLETLQDNFEQLLEVESEFDYKPVAIPLEVAEKMTTLAPLDWSRLEPFLNVQDANA